MLENKAVEQVAMSETTAETMIEMLRGVVTGGTGTSARIPNVRAAGKTGTTSSNNDRWVVGFTPYYTGAVWFGYDTPAPLRGFSPNPAAVAWRKVMTEVHSGLPDKAFLQDEVKGKYNIMVCSESGMRATPECPSVTGKLYASSDIPSKRCTSHPYSFNEDKLQEGSVEVTEKDEEVQGIVDEEFFDMPEDSGQGAQAEPPSGGTETTAPSQGSGEPGAISDGI